MEHIHVHVEPDHVRSIFAIIEGIKELRESEAKEDAEEEVLAMSPTNGNHNKEYDIISLGGC